MKSRGRKKGERERENCRETGKNERYGGEFGRKRATCARLFDAARLVGIVSLKSM